MKPPRLSLLLLWAVIAPLCASVARAGDSRPITIDLGDRDFQVLDPRNTQNWRDWIVLTPKDPLFDLSSLGSPRASGEGAQPIIILDRPARGSGFQMPAQRMFMVSRLAAGPTRRVDAVEFSLTPPPAFSNGQLLRGSSGSRSTFVFGDNTAPIFDPSAAPLTAGGNGGVILLNSAQTQSDGEWSQYLSRRTRRLNLPARDESPLLLPLSGQGRLTAGSALESPADRFLNMFRPGGRPAADSDNPLGLFGQPAKPMTVYPILSGYKYDRDRKVLIDPSNKELAVTEAPAGSGSFALAPPVITPGTRFPQLTLLAANGDVVPTETAVPPKRAPVSRVGLPSFPGWKDMVTNLSLWREVRARGKKETILHCFHPGLVEGATLADTIKKSPAQNLVPCVEWTVPPNDKVTDEGSKNFKHRLIKSVAAVDFDESKLVALGIAGEDGKPVPAEERPLEAGRFAPALAVKVVEKLPVEPEAEMDHNKTWENVVTPLAEWRRVEVQDPAKTIVYCWIGMFRDRKPTVLATMTASPVSGIHTCRVLRAPTPDTVSDPAGANYRTREVVNGGLLRFIDHKRASGKLEFIMAGKKYEVKELAMDAAAFAPAVAIKAGRKSEVPPAPPSYALIAPLETRWLTRVQAKAYEDARKGPLSNEVLKKLDDDNRGLVSANLRDANGSRGKYEQAYKTDPADQKILEDKVTAAIGGLAMWGNLPNPPTAGVPPVGDNAELQLKQAEFDALSVADKTQYRTDHSAFNGVKGVEGEEFDAAKLDPVALHQVIVKWRKSNAAPADAEENAPPLTAEEMALLTPDELTKYLLQLKTANSTPPNASAIKGLSDLSKQYRAAIKADDRKEPFVGADLTEDGFKALKPWQKAQYCAPSAGAAAGTVGAPGADDAHGKNALPDLIARAEILSGKPGTGRSSTAPAWAAAACDLFKQEQALTTPAPAGNGRGNQTADVPTPASKPVGTGDDKENDPKKPNPWFTANLVKDAVIGSMFGLLIGSLFGPIGLVAGPILGAALFYGVSKATTK